MHIYNSSKQDNVTSFLILQFYVFFILNIS